MVLDNDSGRFSEYEDRTVEQLQNVANRLNELEPSPQVKIDWVSLTKQKG